MGTFVIFRTRSLPKKSMIFSENSVHYVKLDSEFNLTQKGLHMSFTRIFMMRRMLVIIYLVSMFAIVTWSSCITIQPEHSRNLKRKRKKKSLSRSENEWDSTNNLKLPLLTLNKPFSRSG